jgi:DNA-binding response OmpR family regulator
MKIKKDFSSYNLLYIEDDEGVRNVNLRILKRMFNEVFDAINGEDAYIKYKEHKPDIIITDLKMPKMDGISLVKKIREEDLKTRIIITTAFTDEKNLIDAVELDVVRYLVKPINQRNLIPALEKACEQISDEKIVKINNDILLDIKNHILINKTKEFQLARKEYMFLEILVNNTQRAVTYDEIENYIWYEEPMSIYSLRTLVGNIRKKYGLEKNIKNISGMGYKLA